MTLDEYLNSLEGDKRLTDASFDALIGRSQSHVSRLRRGEARPSWDVIQSVFNVTGGLVGTSPADWPVAAKEAAE